MSNVYGYVRVSSRDQNEDRQVSALREQAVSEKNIYTIKAQDMYKRFVN